MNLEPGSISSGTMRLVDLIPAVLDALEKVDPDRAAAIREEYSNTLWAIDGAKWESDLTGRTLENALWLYHEVLLDAMQEYCPECHYFGAHPGDGADVGVWMACEGCWETDDYEECEKWKSYQL